MKRQLARPIIGGVLYFLLIGSVLSQSFSDRKTNINQGWSYLENPEMNVEKARNMDGWVSVDLPHTWNNLDATDLDPGYRRSASWYRKALNFAPEKGSRYFLYFEGANNVTNVYVNDTKSGEHIGGYVGFEIEITGQLIAGKNEILVRVDNGYHPQLIPSHQSDFFIFGGITRDVWLKKTAESYLQDITIQTPKVSATSGSTRIVVETQSTGSTKGLEVKVEVKNPAGEIVFSKQLDVQDGQAEMSFTLKDPELWGVKNPVLYTAEVQLLRGKRVVDAVEETYGYRWYEFKEHGPFFLNGERLILRGTHRHEEYAGYGAAMPNALHRQDIEDIKAMGANFVRLGHYPQDPEVYKACDELGILVWDELPWCRGGVGDEVWKENTKRILVEMIDQNYNHPSVILWSLGNEIYWLPEFEDGDNPEKINAFLRELNDLAHALDPYRKTAVRKYYEGADIVDVFSPSIWSGWYSGTYKNYQHAIDNSLKKYPHFVHMEYGGSSHLGRHTESPVTGDGLINANEWEEPINQVQIANIAQNGDWSENYIVDLFDWHLRVSETHPDFAGNAQWAFRDFGTPLRPENDIPYINQKGLVDRAGNPKDAYYVFKSYWSEEPFAYIESHTWTERSGPAGVARNISVFSNADSVELFIRGQSLGMKTRDITQFPACGLNWDVLFPAGDSEFRAVTYIGGKSVAEDTLTVNYTYEKSGIPEALELSYKLLENGNYLITATAVDSKQGRCLDYEERVYFQCLTGGTLVEHMGTPTGSSSIKMANGKAAIEVMPGKDTREFIMTVLNQNFKGTFLKVPINVTP
ncbi:glycoside hydrolase family 2 protein [Marinoscillum luteum]|uniref:Glycoside hydrolase family 2 TIM barrel-domain containing protein n=1 Tax=Marinoscillum luteum TaxID=861051 RepID=A0ABW7NDU4_9BACT